MSGNSKIKILFVTPFAGYTGSEVMLFNMLKNLDSNRVEVAVFSLHNGELLNILHPGFPRYFFKWEKGIFTRIKNKILRILTGISDLERQIMRIHAAVKPDFWYINTLLPKVPVQIAQKRNVKYVVHFHELHSQYKYSTANELQKMVSGASFIVGCCECVCDNLKILGATNIQKQYECFDSSVIMVDDEKKQAIRQELKIPDGHKIITMSGQRTDRKGVDLFIDVAKELRDKPYFFLWLGAAQNTGEDFYFEKYIAHHKLLNICFIHPPRADYYTYLDLTDVFFLSSREDPFPLVMLEAAYLGKYIVSLNSGGSKEFLNENTGHIINSWNISDIAKELYGCIQKQTSAGPNPESRDDALKYDVKVQVKLFEKILLNERPD
jgi:glycosyltransferase involved in cell wall biosynthesis